MTDTRLLVVDDEAPIRRALERALTAHGFAVSTAGNGEDAFDEIASRSPELIVLDLMMPGIDGFEVLRQVRTWSEVPIIVLSARGQESDKVRALNLGADDYLTKPFGMDELLARVRAVLRRSGPPPEGVVELDEITLDLNRRFVARRGVEVHLTPTEYDLLRVLVANRGKVMTHRQLLERVWGDYAVGNSQQLRVYINYLRRKLENDATRPRLIITEPGVGYRLRAEVPD